MTPLEAAARRLMARIVVRPGPLPSPCWLSTYAPCHPAGYTQGFISGHHVMSHRLMYERVVGPIPPGLQLDHLCRTPPCVNPAHLQPVTPLVNTRRGFSPGQVLKRANRCKQGHSLDDAYVSGGTRHCRTCSLNRTNRNRRKKRDGDTPWPEGSMIPVVACLIGTGGADKHVPPHIATVVVE